MAGVTTHLSTRGCETLEMVFRVFVDGVNAGAGIPFFFFVLLPRERGHMCRIEYVRSVLRFSLLCAYVLCQMMGGPQGS